MAVCEDYLEESGIAFFLNDALTQILKTRPERPLEELHHYFKRVAMGDHVLEREFSFVSAALRNRGAFVRAVRSAFPSIHDDELFEAGDLLQLCRMVCPDFPKDVLQQGLAAAGAGTGKVQFGLFRTGFLMWFLYRELIDVLRAKFCDLAVDRKGRNVPVSPHDDDALRAARCVRLELLHAVVEQCYEEGRRPRAHCYPAVSVLDEMLSGVSALTNWDQVVDGVVAHAFTRKLVDGPPRAAGSAALAASPASAAQHRPVSEMRQ